MGEEAGTTIRLAREAMRLSQALLAEGAGVSERTVRRAERGEAISTESARCIGAVLGIDLSAISQASEPARPVVRAPVRILRAIREGLGDFFIADSRQLASWVTAFCFAFVAIPNFAMGVLFLGDIPLMAVAAIANSIAGVMLGCASIKLKRDLSDLALALRGASPFVLAFLNWKLLCVLDPHFGGAWEVRAALWPFAIMLPFAITGAIDLVAAFWRLMATHQPSLRVAAMDCSDMAICR